MDLDALEKEAKRELRDIATGEELEKFRIKYLGRKGELTDILHSIGDLPREKRPTVGKAANRLKNKLERLMEEKRTSLEKESKLSWIDITLPGRKKMVASMHPLNILSHEIIDVFINMGFSIVKGPEMESEYYNFTALNMPEDHPARDMHDTFYLKDGRLLRTHTSPVQIRTLEKEKPPLRIISPGKCYRVDTFDASHSPCFLQIEGLWIDRDVSMSDLFGTLDIFAKEIFGDETRTYFLPSYFPFTEPSAELWIECPFCGGKGCSVCRKRGRIEILGCGMVHPNILDNLGYGDYRGFAFGMGVDRVAMIKYDINDIRLFYQNEIHFLRQFNENKL